MNNDERIEQPRQYLAGSTYSSPHTIPPEYRMLREAIAAYDELAASIDCRVQESEAWMSEKRWIAAEDEFGMMGIYDEQQKEWFAEDIGLIAYDITDCLNTQAERIAELEAENERLRRIITQAPAEPARKGDTHG